MLLTDSDFATDTSNSKSMSSWIDGVKAVESRATLDWGVKKQGSVSRSTGESETNAVCDGTTRSAIPVSLVLEDLGCKVKSHLKSDSSAALSGLKSPKTSKMRMMKKTHRINLHWLAGLVGSFFETVEKVHTDVNTSDIGTKTLAKERFVMLRDMIDVVARSTGKASLAAAA